MGAEAVGTEAVGIEAAEAEPWGPRPFWAKAVGREQGKNDILRHDNHLCIYD